MSAISQIIKPKKFVCASLDDDIDIVQNVISKSLESNSSTSKFYEEETLNVIDVSDDSSDEDLCIVNEVYPEDDEIIILSEKPANINSGQLNCNRSTKFELERNLLYKPELNEIKKFTAKYMKDIEGKISVGLNSQINSNYFAKLSEPTNNGKYFCSICCIEVPDPQAIHDTSITHIMNLGPDNAKPHYSIPNTNKGFQMLLKQGWSMNKGLGPDGNGELYPIKITPKNDRLGLGVKPRIKNKCKPSAYNKINLDLSKKEIHRSTVKSVQSKHRMNIIKEKRIRQILNAHDDGVFIQLS